jgi:hypothetical protein
MKPGRFAKWLDPGDYILCSRLAQRHRVSVPLDQSVPLKLGEGPIDGLMGQADLTGDRLPGLIELYGRSRGGQPAVEITQHPVAGGFDIEQLDAAAQGLHLFCEVSHQGDGSFGILAQRSEQRSLGIGDRVEEISAGASQ